MRAYNKGKNETEKRVWAAVDVVSGKRWLEYKFRTYCHYINEDESSWRVFYQRSIQFVFKVAHSSGYEHQVADTTLELRRTVNDKHLLNDNLPLHAIAHGDQRNSFQRLSATKIIIFIFLVSCYPVQSQIQIQHAELGQEHLWTQQQKIF